MNRLIERWKQQPRSMQWAILAALGLAAFYGLVDPLLEATEKVKSRADAKAAMLDQYQQNRQALETADKTVALGVSRLGNIEMPIESESRAVDFNSMIDDVLSRQDLGDRSSTSRTVPLGNNSALAGVIDASLKVDRLVTELQLTGQPEAIAQIIADLERNPLVTTISRVQMRKAEGRDSGRNIRASISVETWVLSKKGRAK
ncbi:MAG: hypothetical protein ACK54H_03455 [Phycisphaerales bacterium]